MKLRSFLLDDIDFLESCDLTEYTTFQIGSDGNLVIVRSLSALSALLKELARETIPYRVLGWGANQIVGHPFAGLYIKLDLPFDRSVLEVVNDIYELPASVGLPLLTKSASLLGLSGWEVFTGVPASLGGAIAMNAGTNLGEIGEVVEAVEVMNKEGLASWLKMTPESFHYRGNNFLNDGDVIISARLFHKGIDKSLKNKIREYLILRNKSQPMREKTCGCVFRNGNNWRAGQTIDILGLKGFGTENLVVSSIHANFMENLGGATLDEFDRLSSVIKKTMEYYFNDQFPFEVKR